MKTLTGELARFLGVTREDAEMRVANYHPRVLAEEWDKAAPKTAAENLNFYSDKAHDYLYELAAWNISENYYKRIEPVLHYHNLKILEVGAGIGSLCIALAMNGNSVSYCDVSKTLYEFSEQRFNDRLVDIHMYHSIDEIKERDFDMVVACDVLEHIHPDYLKEFVTKISGCLKDRGVFYHRSNFGQQELFPMHYDHTATINDTLKKAGLYRRANGDYVKGGIDKGVQVSVPSVSGRVLSGLTYDLINLKLPTGSTFVRADNLPVDMARNKLVESLSQSWLFFADSDQSFHPETVERLMSWNVDIISGITFQRKGFPIPMVYKYSCKQEEGDKEQPNGHYYKPMIDYVNDYLSKYSDILATSPPAVVLPRAGIFECDGVSGGCLLVNKRVFDVLEKPYFQSTEGKNNGEDFYFCRKAQEAGFKIYCDPSVLCGHYGEYWRGHKHFISYTQKKPFPWSDEV